MKKILVCTQVLILSIFVSCSTDDVSTVETITTSKEFQKQNTTVFSKSLGHYDTLGSFHNLVLETYVSENYSYTAIEDIFLQVKQTTENLGNTTYLSGLAPLENLIYMVNNPASSLDIFIENSDLTALAKTSFSSFATSLSLIESSDDDTFYSTITAYEQSVKADVNLSSADNESILTATTLLKYSCTFRKKRRKDKDWEVSVGNRGNIAAKFQGAVSYDDTTAVIMSVTMEIYLNVNQ